MFPPLSIVSNVQVLQVASGEFLVRDNLDLALALLADDDGLAQVSGAAVNLDAVMEELLEGGKIENLIIDRGRAVDDVLCAQLALACCTGFEESKYVEHYLLGDLLSLLACLCGGWSFLFIALSLLFLMLVSREDDTMQTAKRYVLWKPF